MTNEGTWREEMDPDEKPEPRELRVTDVRGRYPSRPCAIKPGDIEALVIQRGPGMFVIRLDARDVETSDFWMCLTIEIR